MSETNGLSGGGSGHVDGSQGEGFAQHGADFSSTGAGSSARQSNEDIYPALSATVRALAHEKIIALVTNMVEREIVPRLMLAHKGLAQAPFEPQAAPVAALVAESAALAGYVRQHSELIANDNLVERFALMAIREEIQELEVFVSDLIGRGLSDEALYLDLMAPSARHLGEMWTADRCSFTDVTIGLGKLHMLLCYLSDRAFHTLPSQQTDLSVLLVTPQGAQHVFGIRMVDDLFVRAGWLSKCEPSIAPDALEKLVAKEHFDLFGIGVSYSEQVENARALIEIVRKYSHNRHIQVMLGGSLSVDQPDLAQSLGVDLTACDAREAVTIAQTIMNAHKQRI